MLPVPILTLVTEVDCPVPVVSVKPGVIPDTVEPVVKDPKEPVTDVPLSVLTLLKVPP